MDFYHGSQVGGLKKLIPFAYQSSNLSEPLVYLSTKRQIALHYASNYKNLPFCSPMLDIRDDKIIFQEMYSAALELSCKGISGYIYHCEGDFEMSEDHGVKTCAISRIPVPVKKVEVIDDIYNEIMKYKEQGKFEYEKFEDLPQWRYDIIRGHFIRILKKHDILNNINHPHHALLKEKFPIYWKEAIVLSEYGLL